MVGMSRTTRGWSEERHLAALHPDLRRKVAAILTRMRDLGYKPRIYESLRTEAEQREMVRRGVSRTMRSKHLRQKDGYVYAVDIAGEKKAWGESAEFWLTLGRLALVHGCEWGGLWGLPRVRRRQLARFLTMNHERHWSDVAGMWNGGLGWDVAHVELKR